MSNVFADDLKAALLKQFPREQVVFVKGWRKRGDEWLTSNKRPEACLHHHTAGAATSSTDPKAKGNQKGDNAGVVSWVINAGDSHAWANMCLDRDGTVYVIGSKAQWHAGLGDFAGTRWSSLQARKDLGNRYLFGVEIVSKGQKKDLTKAQKKAMAKIDVALREAGQWGGFSKRLMNHKDWTSRKSDTLYSWSYWVRKARAAWLVRKR